MQTKIKFKKLLLLTAVLFTVVFGFDNRLAFGFTEPPLIPVLKPIGGRTWTVCANGCDFVDIKSADTSPYVQSGDTIKIKAGTYRASFTKSGTQGNEIVWEAYGDGDVHIVGNNTNQETGYIYGSHIIIDGGPSRQLIFDGTGITVTNAYPLYPKGSHIIIRRIQVISPDNPNAGSCIVVQAGTSLNIFNSEIHNCRSVGIYNRSGTDIAIKNNIIHDNSGTGIQANPHKSGEDIRNLIIDGNAIYNNGFGTDDDYCRRAGIALLYSQGGYIYSAAIKNNLIWSNGKTLFPGCNKAGGGISLNITESFTDISIYNNHIFNNSIGGLFFNDNFYGKLNFRNNILFNNDIAVYDTSIEAGQRILTNNLTTEPNFLSMDPSYPDFLMPASDSPAIDGGYNLSGIVDRDYLNIPRPQGLDCDIGAYEYSDTYISPSYQCSDSIDNDNDMLTDYPEDSGCDSTTDNDETNTSLLVQAYDIGDFIGLLTDWLQTKISLSDLNSDGIVNSRDLGMMMSKWGN